MPLRGSRPRRGGGRDRVRRDLRVRPALLDPRRGGRVDPAGADGARSRGGRHGRLGGRRRPGPAVGTRVAVHPASPADDGVTRYPADRPNLSPGCTYLGSAARFPHTDGAFVRYATLPSRMLRELPDGLDLRTAAAIEPASVAWHGVARAGDVTGKTVLVIGAGPIGALIVAVLKRAGAAEIVAVDLHDHPLAVARRAGRDPHARPRPTATRSPPCRRMSRSTPAAAPAVWPAPSAAPLAAAAWSWSGCCPPVISRCRCRWRSPASSSWSARSASTTRSTR